MLIVIKGPHAVVIGRLQVISELQNNLFHLLKLVFGILLVLVGLFDFCLMGGGLFMLMRHKSLEKLVFVNDFIMRRLELREGSQ